MALPVSVSVPALMSPANWCTPPVPPLVMTTLLPVMVVPAASWTLPVLLSSPPASLALSVSVPPAVMLLPTMMSRPACSVSAPVRVSVSVPTISMLRSACSVSAPPLSPVSVAICSFEMMLGSAALKSLNSNTPSAPTSALVMSSPVPPLPLTLELAVSSTMRRLSGSSSKVPPWPSGAASRAVPRKSR